MIRAPMLDLINSTARQCTASLVAQGFQPVPCPSTEDDHWLRWDRDRGWKRDSFLISYAQGDPDELCSHVRVQLPLAGDEEGEWLLDGTTVAFVVGRHKSVNRYRFPGALARTLGRNDRWYARRVAGDATDALHWFDHYDSPPKCIERVLGGLTNHGVCITGPSAQRALAYLRAVQGGASVEDAIAASASPPPVQRDESGVPINGPLRRAAIELSSIGVDSHAWRRAEALEAIWWAKAESLAILGGDVLEIVDDRPLHTHDSWSTDRQAGEPWSDFVIRCFDQARGYVAGYPEARRKIFYAVVLISESHWAQLRKASG